VVARFSVPAAPAAVVGATALSLFDGMPVIARYAIGESTFEITAVKFALLEPCR
jgi:hypothetical protein